MFFLAGIKNQRRSADKDNRRHVRRVVALRAHAQSKGAQIRVHMEGIMAVSIQAGWLNSMQSVQNQSAEQGGADRAAGSKQIFAGSLKMPLDPVAQRRQQAREQAWNLVRNAWNSDKDTDKSVQDRMDHYTKMQQLQEEAKAAADDGNDDKKVLQQLYGVAPDSQEQKDLELLEREMNANNGLGDGDFSEEESQRLSELHSGTLTEYQQRALELHKRRSF